MYAVIKTGGKQYRVASGDVIEVERLAGEVGDEIAFDQVLMVGAVGDGAEPQIGTPLVEGAKVTAELLEQARAPKIIVFKKKRRKNYRRKAGHRQLQTVLRVREIAGA
jgi:large subunit ribosomal protein L21